MESRIILKCFIVLGFVINIPFVGKASEGQLYDLTFQNKAINLIQSDSLPSPEKDKPDVINKPGVVTIKEVPKARKVPVPVPVNVKPVKIIKPKIIKPVIKVLH